MCLCQRQQQQNALPGRGVWRRHLQTLTQQTAPQASAAVQHQLAKLTHSVCEAAAQHRADNAAVHRDQGCMMLS